MPATNDAGPVVTDKTPPPESYVLDPDGDLWVVASGTNSMRCSTPVKFRVCSSTLRRCSPVFNKMLFGGFAESRPADSNAEWLIRLPDDAASAIKTLFEIMHCKFHRLNSIRYNGNPKPTILPQLYDLLVFSDKYDTVGLLRHWIREWHTLITKENHNGGPQLLQASWCYYQMGCLKSYKDAVVKLITTCTNFDKIGCEGPGDPALPTAPVLPPGFLELIHSQRNEVVEGLLDPIRQSISRLWGGTGQPAGFCTAMMTKWLPVSDPQQDDCEARILGFMIRQLHMHRLWPVPPPGDAKCAPDLLMQLHRSLLTQREQHSQAAAHNSCAPRHVVFEHITSPNKDLRIIVLAAAKKLRLVDDDSVAYMARQRKITGAPL